jgi:hypothetical protein
MKKLFISSALVLLVGVAWTANAYTIYGDEDSFLGATGDLSLESFEDEAATNTYSTDNLNLSGFTMVSGSTYSPSLGIYDIAPTYSGHATDGSNHLQYQSGMTDSEPLTFYFDDAINSFGLYITDWGDWSSGSLIFSNDAGNSLTIATAAMSALLPNDNEFFFGIILSGFSFTDVTLTSSAEGDAYGIDEIYYGNTAPVPEPATMLLLGMGLVGLAGARRKLKK